MEITILGCGASVGVPILTCACTVCLSQNAKNKRTRTSCLVQYKGKSILIDASPDLRQQLLSNSVKDIDAVLITHTHSDHIAGLDDIRPFSFGYNKSIEIFSTYDNLMCLMSKYPHLFLGEKKNNNLPILIPCIISNYGKFNVGDVAVESFSQAHGLNQESIGFKIESFVYSTDTNFISNKSFEIIGKPKLWALEAIDNQQNSTHANIDQALDWIKKVAPEHAILVHMNHNLDYDHLKSILPEGIEPGYDGLKIKIE